MKIPANEDAPIHFHGAIPNSSRTPRNEVGGLAIYRGVLMISRTGFAMAVRRKDGAISLRQVPLPLPRSRRTSLKGMPFLRGVAMHQSMVKIGNEGFRFAKSVADQSDEDGLGAATMDENHDSHWPLLLGSAAALLTLLIFLPNLLAEFFGPGTQTENPLLFNLLAGIIRLALLLGYVIALGWDADIREVFQYHGAEHKAVHALEENRDVTVARARNYDTIHDRCGTNFIALVCLLSVILFSIGDASIPLIDSGFSERGIIFQKAAQLTLNVLMLPFAAAFSFELIKHAARRPRSRWAAAVLGPGRFFQRFTTRPPNDHQLEVAIVALFAALDISHSQQQVKNFTIRGLEDDESAPGYIPKSPVRKAGEC